MMKNEVLQNIVTRRSIRKYKQTQIKEEELETVLEAGTYAPSGRGMQCPILVAVQAPDTMAKIVKMNAQVLGSDKNPYYGAPTVILVFAPEERTTYIEDASCVLDTMMLAAHSMGLGTVWINQLKDTCGDAGVRKLLTAFGVPEDHDVYACCAIGTALGGAKAPDRKAGATAIVE